MDADDKTIWCGNLAEQVTEELLYELFLQAGPLEKVRIPRERDGRQKNFAFITYCHEVSVPYALNLFRGTALFHKTLSMQCRGRIAHLPPPIKCFSQNPSIDLNNSNVAQQFADMTEKLKGDDLEAFQGPRGQEAGDNLIMASLQGNWQAHRHHPYRPKSKGSHAEPPGRNVRSKDNQDDNSRGNGNNSWRSRRSHNRKRI